MATAMERRPEFGQPTRSFSMTVGLREGYAGNKVHTVEEVVGLVKSFAIEHDIEFGAEIIPTTVVYSYRSEGKMVVHEEPGAKVSGLFPPNKFGHMRDGELVEMIRQLASHLAGPLGQTSFHAEVCGYHHSWKRVGQLTAHEAAKLECPRLQCRDLVAQLGDLLRSEAVKNALQLSERGHSSQTRIGGGPVLQEHIYPVCALVLSRSKNESFEVRERRIAAALCHDLLEDTKTRFDDIRGISEDVGELVEILTETGKTPDRYYELIRNNPDAQVIKVCDRLNNLQCAHKITDRSELLQFLEETEKYILPIVQALGGEDVSTMKRLVTQLKSINWA